MSNIIVTEEDIQEAQKVLGIPSFDEERVNFIKDFSTLDLEAVPGSGKTTALLVKLYILEKHLPFVKNAGVLIISHTNAAVDEIKERLGSHCPKLFEYPNYIGTIQSFVDIFLAIPFANSFLRTRIHTIDEEVFQNRLASSFYKLSPSDQRNISNIFYRKKINIKDLVYNFENGKILNLNKRGELKTFLTDKENPKYKILRKLLHGVVKSGICDFQTTFQFANLYLNKCPDVIDLLCKRFRYVFIDEMQDMDKKKHDILDKLFLNDQIALQRIGDTNQAIFSDSKKYQWSNRNNERTLKGSHRLSPQIASVVNCLALKRHSENYKVDGLSSVSIEPCMIIYDDSTKDEVVPYFIKRLKQFQKDGLISETLKHPIKVIASVTEKKEDLSRITLQHFYEKFKKNSTNTKIHYDNINDYFTDYDNSIKSLKPIRTNLLQLFLRILRIEEIKNNGKQFSIRSLYNFINYEIKRKNRNEFKLNLYKWSMSCVVGDHLNAKNEFIDYLPEFLDLFRATVKSSTVFINKPSIETTSTNSLKAPSNLQKIDGINIEFASLQSTKGQTHTATLFIESYFNKKYESCDLSKYLNGSLYDGTGGGDLESKLMKTYVGLSRATHFLCYAIHKNQYEKNFSDGLNKEIWDFELLCG